MLLLNSEQEPIENIAHSIHEILARYYLSILHLQSGLHSPDVMGLQQCYLTSSRSTCDSPHGTSLSQKTQLAITWETSCPTFLCVLAGALNHTCSLTWQSPYVLCDEVVYTQSVSRSFAMVEINTVRWPRKPKGTPSKHERSSNFQFQWPSDFLNLNPILTPHPVDY